MSELLAPLAVNVETAAALMSLGVKTVYELCDNGELASVRVGNRIVIRPSAIEAFLAAREQGGEA